MEIVHLHRSFRAPQDGPAYIVECAHCRQDFMAEPGSLIIFKGKGHICPDCKSKNQ